MENAYEYLHEPAELSESFKKGSVGAIIDRPAKNGVFRISRREITIFSPDGDEFCWSKIRGRPMVAPTIALFDTLKAAPP